MRTFFLLSAIFGPSIALAAPATYDLLAPIGTLTSTPTVTLKMYLEGVFQTAVGITGVLAVIMIVICGIRLMGSGSVAGKSEAKQCIWNAVFGILLVIGSWLLLNTINPLLLKDDAQLTVDQAAAPPPTPGAPTAEAAPTANGCYFQYKDSSGSTRYIESGTQEMCETLRNDYQSSGIGSVLTSCFCNKPATPGTPPPSPATPTSAPPPTIAGSITCFDSGRNLCEPKARQCTNSSCAKFIPMANRYAGGAVSANLLKAIIVQESSCGQKVVGPTTQYGQACGPIQILPSTANRLLSRCGLTESVTCSWLSNPANWDKAVCLGAEYLRDISRTSCGTDVRNMAAGYNAGPGRCSASANCASDTSCSGRTVQQWECLYDNSAHTICNGGFVETRNYVGNVLYCTTNPGY